MWDGGACPRGSYTWTANNKRYFDSFVASFPNFHQIILLFRRCYVHRYCLCVVNNGGPDPARSVEQWNGNHMRCCFVWCPQTIHVCHSPIIQFICMNCVAADGGGCMVHAHRPNWEDKRSDQVELTTNLTYLFSHFSVERTRSRVLKPKIPCYPNGLNVVHSQGNTTLWTYCHMVCVCVRCIWMEWSSSAIRKWQWENLLMNFRFYVERFVYFFRCRCEGKRNVFRFGGHWTTTVVLAIAWTCRNPFVCDERCKFNCASAKICFNFRVKNVRAHLLVSPPLCQRICLSVHVPEFFHSINEMNKFHFGKR